MLRCEKCLERVFLNQCISDISGPRSREAWLYRRICLLARKPLKPAKLCKLWSARSALSASSRAQIVILLESGLWLGNAGLAIWNTVAASSLEPCLVCLGFLPLISYPSVLPMNVLDSWMQRFEYRELILQHRWPKFAATCIIM